MAAGRDLALDEDQLMFLEADYRAGVKPLDVLSSEFKVSKATIAGYSRRYGWERDFKAQVKARADELVNAEVIKQNTAGARSAAIDKAQVIEVAATVQKQVILASQKRIQALQSQVDGLMSELAAQSLTAKEIGHIGELVALAQGQLNETEVAPAVVEKRIAAFKKMLSLGDRVAVAKALGETLKTLIGLERQAFGLSDNANGEADTAGGEAVVQSMNDAARRVAFLLAQATRQSQEKVINP